MRALYISHNGMAENLGQSQVLPYLRGLVRRGLELDLVSYELTTLEDTRRRALVEDMERDGIRWHPLRRTLGGSLAVKLREAEKGAALAARLVVSRRPDIVHGRSYFPSAIGDAASRVASLAMRRQPRLLFDCRGMLGDEYVDCGHWTKDRLEYRLLKRYERRLFFHADGVVVLTSALARWLREHDAVGASPDLEVVPCCVDLAKFAHDAHARARVRADLGVADEQLLVVYSGSLGTWYLEPQMARFVGELREAARARGRRVAFACLTPSDASGLVAHLRAVGLSAAEITARKVEPARMPEFLSAGDVGLSFIQSCFSKTGSSPTKVAEYLACGSVVVANGDIGDQADLGAEKEACVILDGFGEPELQRAARRAVELVTSRPRGAIMEATRACALRHFGLEEVGIPRYSALYERLAGARLAVPGAA